MNKYQNKYRIDSTRLNGYDYTKNGAYFITICTQNREHHFGEIQNGKMVLSPCGVLADVFLHDIPNRNDGVEIGTFVVMPNHIHVILILNRDTLLLSSLSSSSLSSSSSSSSSSVETRHASSLQQSQQQSQQQQQQQSQPSPQQQQQQQQQSEKNEKMAAISPKAGSVSIIIGSYKSAVTKHANRLELPNGWQTRFHDHIIRNETEYDRIFNYIENNPSKWETDTFNDSNNPLKNV